MATSASASGDNGHGLPETFATPSTSPRQHRLRTALLATLALLALFAAAGFFAIPAIVQWKIEALARTELGREATVGKVRFNPFTLRATVSEFSLADRDRKRVLFRFDVLDVVVSTESIWKRALVLDSVRLVRPQVEIARSAAGEYNIQDLVERASAPSTPPASKADFVFDNIEIDDGSVVLDDAVHHRRIAVSDLSIGIPFLSSRSRDEEIRVRPHLRGAIDGAPFAFNGRSTSPFGETRQATLDIDLDALSLPRYVDYAPLPNGLKLTDGALTTRLTLAFVSWKGASRSLILTGNARLDRLAIARKDASPFMAAKAVDVALGKLDLLGRTVAVDRLSMTDPVVDVRRLSDGSVEAQRLLAIAPAGGTTDDAGAPWTWSVAAARISGGAVRVSDEAVAPPFNTRLSDVTVTGTGLASRGAPGSVDVAFDSEDGAHFALTSEVDIAGNGMRGHFAVTKLPLARLDPYYSGMLALDVRRGALDASADFDAGANPVRFTLAQGSLALSALDLAIRGEREPLWRMANANVEGLALDLAKRTVGIDRIEARQGFVRLLRDADGTMHFERLLRKGSARTQGAGDVAAASGTDWELVVHRLALEQFQADFEDQAISPAVELHVADARLHAENLRTAPGAKASVDVAARVGSRGRVQVSGMVGTRPMSAELRVNATALDLVPLKPYLEPRTNVTITSGALSARGRVSFANAGTDGPRFRYVGDIAVSDFGSLDRPGSQELMNWKTLSVTGADVNSTPFKVTMDVVALDRFYARLILGADARLNVLTLLSPDASAQAPSPPADAGSVAAAEAPAPPSAGERREVPASIGRIQLTNGEVEYSDFFVKPNYSAHLTRVDGNVSALDPAQDSVIALTARVDDTAPVDIRGTVNPFARVLALDVTGKATDVDLPPLTPYSVKYAGYGIQKGKLSMEVHYKLQDRKLAATNKVVLDQLTFGERVDSPTATKLPVLLAVALLKDRNGVINLDLPISGTLDDPQFSVWGVVVQIIGNLLAKVATAPFALLGAIAGGGEQLSYVEFAPGSAALTPAAEAKLASLAKALADRPGLKVDAMGRAIPEADSQGLKRASLEQAMRIRKQKDLAAAGEGAAALDDISIDASDYAKYLKGVYGDARLKDKPRNFIGMAKDIPAAEMESLLLASYSVDENALRELANQRAQVVKGWFASKGGIEAARVFVIAPRLSAEGLKAGETPTRVEFAIR